MKKIPGLFPLLLVVIAASIACADGLRFKASYDLTNKVDVKLSGVDFAYNYNGGAPGLGLFIDSSSDFLGLSLGYTHFIERSLESATLYGITLPLASKPKFTEGVAEINALLKINEHISMFGGINYPVFGLTNTTATAVGVMGYQAGATVMLGMLSVEVTYRIVNANFTDSNGVQSQKYSAEGFGAAVVLNI